MNDEGVAPGPPKDSAITQNVKCVGATPFFPEPYCRSADKSGRALGRIGQGRPKSGYDSGGPE
jgi:hypothetical protein